MKTSRRQREKSNKNVTEMSSDRRRWENMWRKESTTKKRKDSERDRTVPEPSPATYSRAGPLGMEIVSAYLVNYLK